MIRLTEAQYIKLSTAQSVRSEAISAIVKRSPMKSKVKSRLKEADVTKQCVQFLRARGWYLIRLQSGLFQRPGSKNRILVGKRGMADYLALRRIGFTQLAGHIMGIFIELKAKGRKPLPSQIAWAAEMRRLGFLVETVDDLDSFAAYYERVFGRDGIPQ